MHPQQNYPYQAPPPLTKTRPGGKIGHRLLVLGLTFVLYLIACSTPALYLTGGDKERWFGFEVLVFGWLGALIGQFAWFANLLLLLAIALLLFRRWIATLVCSLLATSLALHTIVIFSQDIPLDEGGVRHAEVIGLGVGFYIWLLSLLSIGAGAILLRQRESAARRALALQQP